MSEIQKEQHLSELNLLQKEAVLSEQKRLLVLAGAGLRKNQNNNSKDTLSHF